MECSPYDDGIDVEADLRWELASDYLARKKLVLLAGFGPEIRVQAQAATVDGPTFLREAAWVILNSGMRERVVRGIFPAISRSFLEFEPAPVCQNSFECTASALQVFRHEPKISAIVAAARMAQELGDEGLREAFHEDAESLLRSIPFVGPITWRHLAKNLGVPCAKPDRHLKRLADREMLSVEELCRQVSVQVGDPIHVVDLVLWRSCSIGVGSAGE
ncbi:hypothetical protein [Actinomycetospora flava]|uniref:HhH-GPD domain-containing protein n=1 Tax=Actinomycetospora flava TaxID=3129232 RepID=A0ABU8M3R0_9PSEU